MTVNAEITVLRKSAGVRSPRSGFGCLSFHIQTAMSKNIDPIRGLTIFMGNRPINRPAMTAITLWTTNPAQAPMNTGRGFARAASSMLAKVVLPGSSATNIRAKTETNNFQSISMPNSECCAQEMKNIVNKHTMNNFNNLKGAKGPTGLSKPLSKAV